MRAGEKSQREEQEKGKAKGGCSNRLTFLRYIENRQNNATCRPCMGDSHRPHRTPRVPPSSLALCGSLASRPQQIIPIVVLWTIDLHPLFLRFWHTSSLN